MNVDRLLTRPVEVSTPTDGAVDEYGTPTAGASSTVTVDGYVEQTSTTEVTEGQQTAPGRWWAALPTGTAVTARSRLTIVDSGQTFEVVGEPATRWNPRLRRNEFVRVELASVTA